MNKSKVNSYLNGHSIDDLLQGLIDNNEGSEKKHVLNQVKSAIKIHGKDKAWLPDYKLKEIIDSKKYAAFRKLFRDLQRCRDGKKKKTASF